MLDNIKTPLFKTIEKKVQTYNTQCNEERYVEVSLDTAIEESLTKIVELSKFNSSNHMITIKYVTTNKCQLLLCLKFRHEVECYINH